MLGYMWKATVRNINRALKEVNAFEREGDYRPETAQALNDLVDTHGQARGTFQNTSFA